MIVYLSHPYRSNPVQNAQRVREICRCVVNDHYLPLAPQIYLPTFVDEARERDLALALCRQMVAVANEVWVYGEPSEGMRLEIAEAHRLGIPVVRKELPWGSEHSGQPPRR